MNISSEIEREFELFYDEMVHRTPEIKEIDKHIFHTFFTHGGKFSMQLLDKQISNIASGKNGQDKDTQ